MTTVHEIEKKCMHCGSVHRFDVLASTSSFGRPDLDTRPAPLARQAIQFEIERCPNCNYASDDIEEKIDFDDSLLTSDNYLKVLKSDYPELAKSYILASMIQESIENYAKAALFMLKVCWVLDDNKLDAKKPRLIAVKLFEKIEGEESKLIIIDLYRRAEEFEKARFMINKSKEIIEDNYLKEILKCQEVLVDLFDSECHSCSEIDNFIGESGLEEKPGADSPEEMERKLFEEDCDEPIRLYNSLGEIISFSQVAIIPIEHGEKKNIYAILQPLDIELEDEDEALVFSLVGDDKLEGLELVTDDSIVDEVFDEYYRLIEDSQE